MLCKSLLFIFAIFALSAAHTYLAEDQFVSEYLLAPIPLVRQRRQTTLGIDQNPRGTQVTLGHKGTIFENEKHSVTGDGFVSKNFFLNGPTTVGGGVGYEHIPSGSRINLRASNTLGFGTDISATGTANLWKNENSRLDAYANYGRHYGGPWGTGEPNYGAGIQFEHRF